MDRIALGNEAFEGQNNAYILEDGNSLALVDTGISTTETRTRLSAGLTDRGFEVSDVDDIVLTHYHADHVGLAGELQAESDATVYVHTADAPIVEQHPEAMSSLRQKQERSFVQWGMPASKREELFTFLDTHRSVIGSAVSVTPIEAGTTLSVGGYILEAVHTPGHTAGHCCYEILETPHESTDTEGDRVGAFVGDAVLPEYTPNIGGADVRVDHPLTTYLESLRVIDASNYTRLWPGHRDPIDDPSDRIRTIVSHHHDRTVRVLNALRSGPADAWTVSQQLFGDLESIHIMHGPGEAYAHLEYLHREGVLDYNDGTYTYASQISDEMDFDKLVGDLFAESHRSR